MHHKTNLALTTAKKYVSIHPQLAGLFLWIKSRRTLIALIEATPLILNVEKFSVKGISTTRALNNITTLPRKDSERNEILSDIFELYFYFRLPFVYMLNLFNIM